jgi:hypothetical protein
MGQSSGTTEIVLDRSKRVSAIRHIEKLRGSRVLAYVTGDRSPTPAQIGDDALRPIYEHLRAFDHPKKIDLFIYSRGGATDVPWRIATALRQSCDEWNILVPFRANSAATLLALGADEIVLGRHGELGPIDPLMNLQRVVGQVMVPEVVSVEDVMAYLRFASERGGLSDQSALSASLSKLSDRVDALSLGNAYRTYSHIRDVARRMLLSRKNPANQVVMETIVETLAEKVYAHGHAIGFADADAIGLPVKQAENALDAGLWDLLKGYEEHLKLLSPVDVYQATQTNDVYTEPTIIATVESTDFAYELSGEMQVRLRRQMPASLNVSVSVNLEIPAADPIADASQPQLQQQLQQLLQQALAGVQQLVSQQAQVAVQQALQQQAPIINIEPRFVGKWGRVG